MGYKLIKSKRMISYMEAVGNTLLFREMLVKKQYNSTTLLLSWTSSAGTLFCLMNNQIHKQKFMPKDIEHQYSKSQISETTYMSSSEKMGIESLVNC